MSIINFEDVHAGLRTLLIDRTRFVDSPTMRKLRHFFPLLWVNVNSIKTFISVGTVGKVFRKRFTNERTDFLQCCNGIIRRLLLGRSLGSQNVLSFGELHSIHSVQRLLCFNDHPTCRELGVKSNLWCPYGECKASGISRDPITHRL